MDPSSSTNLGKAYSLYESKSDPILPVHRFWRRILNHLLVAFGVIFFCLGIGIAGYALFEKMSFVDALLNASMILGGMGPVGELKTVGGKLFASFYALFSGVVFIAAAGIIFAPFLHRMMHAFHLDDESKD
jgi:hypothetical protein